MSITIELPSGAEEYLKDMAAHEGQPAETVAARLLIETLEHDANDFAEAVEGIRCGFDDVAAGRTSSADDVFARLRARIEAAKK